VSPKFYITLHYSKVSKTLETARLVFIMDQLSLVMFVQQ